MWGSSGAGSVVLGKEQGVLLLSLTPAEMQEVPSSVAEVGVVACQKQYIAQAREGDAAATHCCWALILERTLAGFTLTCWGEGQQMGCPQLVCQVLGKQR